MITDEGGSKKPYNLPDAMLCQRSGRSGGQDWWAVVEISTGRQLHCSWSEQEARLFLINWLSTAESQSFKTKVTP